MCFTDPLNGICFLIPLLNTLYRRICKRGGYIPFLVDVTGFKGTHTKKAPNLEAPRIAFYYVLQRHHRWIFPCQHGPFLLPITTIQWFIVRIICSISGNRALTHWHRSYEGFCQFCPPGANLLEIVETTVVKYCSENYIELKKNILEEK